MSKPMVGPGGLPLWDADTEDPKKPYGDVEYADPGYQEDGKKRYPVDTEEHVRAAWSYINQDENAGKYSSGDLAKVKANIKRAAKKFGVEIAEDSVVDLGSLRDRLKRPLARAKSGSSDWYRIQNKAGEAPKLYIYDEIGYFGDTAKGLSDDLRGITADTLDVHVNSPGGDIFDGLAIYQALKNHSAQVTVHVDGLAASIASVIAMAGDRIVMAPKASIMIHDGWTMAVGNAEEMRKAADLLDKQSQVIASVYADRSGQTADFWRDRMRDETWYTADEALTAGLVDEIQGQEKKSEEPFDLSVFAHAGRGTAPEPVLVAKAAEPEEAAPAAEPTTEEETPFTWDFSSFKSALQEGVKRA